MEPILQSVCELPGVTASFVFNLRGELAGLQGHAIYDQALLERVSQSLVKALESVQLQMTDWDTLTAHFDEGKLLLRNLGTGADGEGCVLAVIGDAQVTTPFAAVALRVAVQKLKKVLDGSAAQSSPRLAGAQQPMRSQPGVSQPGMSRPGISQPRSSPPGVSRPQSAAAAAQAAVASSGMTWSKLSGSSGSSGIEVADAASSNFLTRCSKELARHVGPMSKIYVKEAVRRVSPSAPFALSLAKQLVDDLANQIEDREERIQFRKALEHP
jgi:hypothetical protein